MLKATKMELNFIFDMKYFGDPKQCYLSQKLIFIVGDALVFKNDKNSLVSGWAILNCSLESYV